MSILSLAKVNKYYSNVQILKDISFFVEKNDKLAIIGKNGAGKSTLLKIICGIEDADSGEIHLAKSARLGYMEQAIEENSDLSILNYCMNVFEDLMDMEIEIRKMEDEMSIYDSLSAEFTELLHQYDEKMAKFTESGGLMFKSKVKSILTGLGFEEAEHHRKISTLSGGQLNRLNLARLIASEPDLLILDEPTNHLDMKSVAWLESYLKNYPNPILFVSHDRYFIDAVANKTMEIELGRATLYKGNYTDFKYKSREVKKAYLSAYQKQREEIEKQQELITSFKQRGTEKLAKRAKSREKALERLEILEKPEYEQTDIKIRLNIARASGKDVLRIEHLNKAYSKPILKDISVNVYRNQKIGIVGDNGSGKTTLLKIISSELQADSGYIKYGHNVDISYYDQNLDGLNPQNTVLQEIVTHYPSFDDTDARTFLGRFLFFGEEVFKRIGNLSGGEKARVTLAKLILNNSNFLLLDEPTNHLDIYTCEILEDALQEYQGTICVISHDRYFLNTVCNHIWNLENARMTEHIGNFDDFMQWTQAISQTPDPSKNTLNSNKHPPALESAGKQEQIKNWEQEKQAQKIERKRRKDIEKLEVQIQELEKKIMHIDEALCTEEVYSDHVKALELSEQKSNLEAELEHSYSLLEAFLD